MGFSRAVMLPRAKFEQRLKITALFPETVGSLYLLPTCVATPLLLIHPPMVLFAMSLYQEKETCRSARASYIQEETSSLYCDGHVDGRYGETECFWFQVIHIPLPDTGQHLVVSIQS